MSLLDRLKDGLERIIPANRRSRLSGGIAGGHGMVHPGDDMIVSKTSIVLSSLQIFFDFLAMACFASVASFQAKWKVGPSGLTGFSIFTAVSSILLSLFLLLVPVIYEKYDKFVRLARALKEVRVGFILTGTGVINNFLIAFILTISAWTEPGCKDPAKDPNASKGDGFKQGLHGFCDTKKAGAIFFWFAFLFWLLWFGLLVKEWRDGEHERSHPRDPPFTHPTTEHEVEEEGDDESTLHELPMNRDSPFADRFEVAPAASRPSMDAYGAFSDPAPSGFGSNNRAPEQVSRTMQYADPYALVRAQINNTEPPPYR